MAQPLQRHGASQRSPLLGQGRQRFVVAREYRREHDYGWGVFGRFLDHPRPIKLPLSPARYKTSTGSVRGSWCLQVHLASAFARGIQRNEGESRGAAVDS